MRKILMGSLIAATTLLASVAAEAQAGVKAGRLTCTVESGMGFIIGSKRDLDCVFTSGKGVRERYVGTTTVFGVDVGYTGIAKFAWVVMAPGRIHPGSLNGHYGGVVAHAAIGIGGGAHVLVGGMRDSIALQPVGVRVGTGLHATAGLNGMNLEYVAERKKSSKAKKRKKS